MPVNFIPSLCLLPAALVLTLAAASLLCIRLALQAFIVSKLGLRIGFVWSLAFV